MELLGHSQINLTLNTYSRVLPSVHKEAAAAMDRDREVAHEPNPGKTRVDSRRLHQAEPSP